MLEHKRLGNTDLEISTIGLGTWALGGSWGATDDEASIATLNRALDLGVNFFDTADVYGGGRSERLLGRLRRDRKESFYIATKVGLKIRPQEADLFTKETIVTHVEDSLTNLGVEAIDLLQLHSPPTDAYYRPEIFETLECLVDAGKVRYCGISVNRVEEGLKALDYPVIQSIQIVFNIFRQRSLELLFPEAQKHSVGILARLPLSSGMLTGKMNPSTTFEETDHRNYNRNGDAFDHGDTFSGMDYDIALKAVEELLPLVPDHQKITQWALRWVLMHEAVTSVIPGARRPNQVEENLHSVTYPPFDLTTMDAIRRVYNTYAKPQVHAKW